MPLPPSGDFPPLSDPLSTHWFALPWANVPSIRPLWASVALFLSAVALLFFFTARANEFVIIIDNYEMKIRSQHQQVLSVLRDAGVTVRVEDSVVPPLNSVLAEGNEIVINRAIPVGITADGSYQDRRTQKKALDEILQEAGLTFSPYDILLVDGRYTAFQDNVQDRFQDRSDSSQEHKTSSLLEPRLLVSTRGGTRPDQPTAVSYVESVDIQLKRAITIYVHDDNVVLSLPTTGATLGEALEARGVNVLQNDIVSEPLESQVQNGKHYYIARAKPVSIRADGKTINHRTQLESVGEALKEAKIALSPIDRVEPASETKVKKNLSVDVIRVREDVITERENIAFTTKTQGDPELEIDNQYVIKQGSNGVLAKNFRVTYEDGVETNRVRVKDAVEVEPQDKIFAYGTKIVVRQLETSSGTISYWRKTRMFVTSYNASQGGKARSNPGYGRTALGLLATHGIIAVDPRVIPFYTKMYVPGYGVGMAGDTGGGVKGLMIDLAYAEDEPNDWSSRYSDVYFLTPIPPASQIQWMLN